MKINGINIVDLGLGCGWINRSHREAFALSGTFSLPGRQGKTYHDWQGNIEPYVNVDEIIFEPRDFALSLTCRAASLGQLNAKVKALYAAIGNSITLEHDKLGSFELLVISATTTHYANGWGQVVVKLKELRPLQVGDLRVLPNVIIPATYGIDGYSWRELGLVVSGVKNRYDLPQFKPLKLTVANHSHGSREPRMITIEGTIKGGDFTDLEFKTSLLRSVLGRAGLRSVRYFDGSQFECFGTDGVTIDNVIRTGSGAYWGRVNSKLIVVR